MINQTDDYLMAFLAHDSINELTSDRRRSELIGSSWTSSKADVLP